MKSPGRGHPSRSPCFARAENAGTTLNLWAGLRSKDNSEQFYDQTVVTLTQDEEEYFPIEWDLPVTSFPVETVEIRISAPDPGQVWLDAVRLTDDLEWLSEGSQPPVYAQTEEGYLTRNGQPYFPRLLWWSNDNWRDFDELHDAFEDLNDAGFTGIVAPPRQGDYSAYSRRGLRIFLDTAECYGLEVMVMLPTFPCCTHQADWHWPKHAGLVRDWVDAFSDHPALFGWLLRDEVTWSQLDQIRNKPWPIRQWVRETEGNYPDKSAHPERFHPLLVFTSEAVFTEFGWPQSGSSFLSVNEFHGVVDGVMPNLLPIQKNQTTNEPRRRFSTATKIARSERESPQCTVLPPSARPGRLGGRRLGPRLGACLGFPRRDRPRRDELRQGDRHGPSGGLEGG